MLILFLFFYPFLRPAFPFNGEPSGKVILPAHTRQGIEKFLHPDTPFRRVYGGRQHFTRGSGEFRHEHGGQMMTHLHAASVRFQLF